MPVSSARAENRNALSGTSRSSAPPAHSADVPHNRQRKRNSRFIGRMQALLALWIERTRFGGDPVEVGGITCRDWDSDDFREFIRMHGADGRFERGIAVARGLDQHRMLLRAFNRPLPPVDRAARRKDVDARGKPRLHQRLRQPLRAWALREGGGHEPRFHGAGSLVTAGGGGGGPGGAG